MTDTPRLIRLRAGAEVLPLQVRVDEAAKLLGYSPTTVRRLVRRGELPAVGRGRLLRIALADLNAYLARNRDGGAP